MTKLSVLDISVLDFRYDLCFFFLRRILVLDNGLVKEFDTPKNLLSSTNSAFLSMAKDAGLVA